MVDPLWYCLPVALVALLVYLRTMCRTIYVGDSGELSAAVHVLGIPHPPGYPAYVLLGKLFSILVPIGSPALRLNLFSAICTGSSVAFVYLTLLLLQLPWHVSAAAALTWAFSASLWSQSGIPRVYALGALISALATYLAIRWYVDPQQTLWLVASALVVCVGLANHPVVAAHAPAVLLMVILHEPAVLRDPWLWVMASLCLLVPLALYFGWIPWRARRNPVVNWGNIRTWSDLRKFLARKEYWRHRYVRSFPDAFEVIWFYVGRIGIEFGFLGTAAIIVGLFINARFLPAIFAMIATLFVLNMASMIAHARREDIFHWTRYMITAWFALLIPLALGWNHMLSVVPEPAQPFLAFLPAIFLFIAQFWRQDLSRHRYADEYNRRILQSLPENATLIAQDDNVVFPLMYLKYAENVRPDVKLLEQGVHQLREFKFNPRRDAVYCTHWQAAFNQPASPRGPGLRLVNEGLIYRIVSTDMNYQPRNLWNEHLVPEIDDERIPKNYLTRCLLGNVYFMRGEWELPRDAVSAVAWYHRAARIAWDSAVQHYNLGLVYERQGWKLMAEDEFAQAASIDRNYRRSSQRTTDQVAGAMPQNDARPHERDAVARERARD